MLEYRCKARRAFARFKNGIRLRLYTKKNAQSNDTQVSMYLQEFILCNSLIILSVVVLVQQASSILQFIWAFYTKCML
jgi:hypothetical protein